MLKKLENELSGFTIISPFDTGCPKLKIASLLIREQHPDGPEPFFLPGRHALNNDMGTDFLIAVLIANVLSKLGNTPMEKPL